MTKASLQKWWGFFHSRNPAKLLMSKEGRSMPRIKVMMVMVVCLAISLGLSHYSLAFISPEVGKNNLIGIKSLTPIFTSLPEEVISSGYKSDELKTDVELKLRLAGIEVIDFGQQLKIVGKNPDGTPKIEPKEGAKTGDGTFSVDVMAAKNQMGTVSYLVIIGVLNSVIPLDKFIEMAKTFELTGKIGPYVYMAGLFNDVVAGMCAESQFRQVIKNAVGKIMDRFVNHYLSVNPKK
jgi:hypothetical protein